MTAGAAPLLDELRREADLSVNARIASARDEAARITAAADDRRDRRRTDAVAERERQLARARETARDEAQAATAAGVLTARAALLERLSGRAAELLTGLAGDPTLPLRLRSVLTEALPFLPTGSVRVRCAATSATVVREALAAAGRSDVQVATDESVPVGALLEDPAGTVRVDATLAARLRRMWPELSIEAMRLVEGAAP